MAALTLEQMLERQAAANELHNGYVTSAASAKATEATAKETLAAALRSGDADAYDTALSALETATANVAKYEALAANTGDYLYTPAEVSAAIDVKERAFMNGAIKSKLASIDTKVGEIITLYSECDELIDTYVATQDGNRAKLVAPAQTFRIYTPVDRDELLAKVDIRRKLRELGKI